MRILPVGAELFRANRETLRHDEANCFLASHLTASVRTPQN
jgi:hypothetical protein